MARGVKMSTKDLLFFNNARVDLIVIDVCLTKYKLAPIISIITIFDKQSVVL